MAFDNIVGQTKIKEILSRSLAKQRVPHALLFHGPEGVGKEAMALEMAKALVCQQDKAGYCNTCPDCQRIGQLTHPDVYYIYPAMSTTTDKEHAEVKQSIVQNPYLRLNPWASPTISIDRIREIKRTSAMTSFENKGRVVIIAEAQKMTVEATNSLLKILEEPPDNMTIILTSSQPALLLPTIISRCQNVRFSPLNWDEIEQAIRAKQEVSVERSNLVAKLSSGSLRRAFELLDEALDERRERTIEILRTVIRGDMERLLLVEELVAKEEKKTIQEYLEIMLVWFRDVMIFSEGGDESMLVNLDKRDTLERFSQSFESFDYHAIVGQIEQALERIRRYVYINLILINLFSFLKQQLRRKHG
ncbi:DNA polymerase III subunit delta' [candidate division KSB1 bacterium]|nr:DNA polymerase III subunit delta' [candidate division KSB1 bacterium]